LLGLACCVWAIEHIGYRLASVQGRVYVFIALFQIEELLAALSVAFAFFGIGWQRLVMIAAGVIFFVANDGRVFA
jgi:hypothetical protein